MIYLEKGLTCLRVQPSFLLHLFYFNDLNGLNRLFHQLIDLLIQILFRTADHINIRLGYRMFCHEDRTAVFERLDRGLICVDLLRDLHDLLLVKSDQRTVNRHRTYIIGCRKALHGLTCHLSDTLTCDHT